MTNALDIPQIRARRAEEQAEITRLEARLSHPPLDIKDYHATRARIAELQRYAAHYDIDTLLARIDALEAERDALVGMVHTAEQECTRWQCVMEAVQDHINAPIDSDDYSTALSLIGDAVVDVSFYELDDSEEEVAEQRAWILKALLPAAKPAAGGEAEG